MGHREVGGPGRVAEDQRVVDAAGVEEIASMCPPTWRVRHRKSLEVRKYAQPSSHSSDLRVLLLLGLEDVLLDGRGYRIPRSIGGVVNRYLRVQRARADHHGHRQQQQTS